MPPPILMADGLGVSFGSLKVLEDVSFSLEAGRFALLVGENGAGKSTLIRALAGVVRPRLGRTEVLGRDPATDPHGTRESVQYLAEGVLPPTGWPISDFLDFHSRFFPRYSKPHEGRLLADYGLDPRARIGSLSTGQIRRVQIVSALASRPRVLLIDEITAVLDILGRQRFFDHLTALRREESATIFLGTNLLDNLDRHATDVLVLHGGKLVRHWKDPQTGATGTLADRIAALLQEVETKHGNVLPFSKTGSEG